ncbi:molybdopterin-containing oxidoreductase family protein [Novosphingobium pentaromativorans]|uniref:4Fe-4S Mo/W bis-MGD-type domain-containing protein n=1 Tax=Novosphingobium pentaromativorans US6-1 TaxID=1088721 RepID=G6EGN8_9SPHN|nr:molybdopterin-dependent oxidoreductase [Novosphingobium pentaromativorans]AIT82137.1 hypothetical protein JI59_21660 [Novosphingobium pentaromativorans US6-1]EHJ59585.1 hypothetical protein NSU_3468 [Novosphingobium pentaromativorans US6-1]
MREEISFCRICCVSCAMKMQIDDNDRIVSIRGDKTNPMSRGYACYKGLQAEDLHHGPGRILRPLKRLDDGSFKEIPYEQAFDEIAAKMQSIIDRDGPDAIATFKGVGSFSCSTAYPMPQAFTRAIESSAYFTTATVDQSAKFITHGRMGGWAAGKPNLDQSDVAILFGTNPLVSHALMGFLSADPTKILKEARNRGLKLIVVDPRRSETAQFAALHLQPLPGEDASIAAGLIRIILENGWEDSDFCNRHVAPGGLARLRQAVEPYTPEMVAKRAGIEAELLLEAATLFAKESKRGAAWTATGVTMSPRSNLADHMVSLLNVICGRFRREGDKVTNIVPWHPPFDFRAEVIPPDRHWEKAPPGRIRGAGNLLGERMACNFADEILTPGKGQIKAVLNGSCNLASSLPDQRKVVSALRSLELLVSVDPFMSTTARLSHYILPVKLEFERFDLPLAHVGVSFYPVAFGAYARPVIAPPAGSDVVDDWYIYWSLAKRLGKQISFEGTPLDMQTPPTSEMLIELLAKDGQVPLAEIKKYPGGHIFDIHGTVGAARPEACARFDVMPDEVFAELTEVAVESTLTCENPKEGQPFTHRLAVRRDRNVVNSQTALPYQRRRRSYNPAWLNPQDIVELGLEEGDRIWMTSDHGRIPAAVSGDPSVRPGVVQMSHGWGQLPDDPGDFENSGANTNLLISSERDMEPINSMARLSAIPVAICRMD